VRRIRRRAAQHRSTGSKVEERVGRPMPNGHPERQLPPIPSHNTPHKRAPGRATRGTQRSQQATTLQQHPFDSARTRITTDMRGAAPKAMSRHRLVTQQPKALYIPAADRPLRKKEARALWKVRRPMGNASDHLLSQHPVTIHTCFVQLLQLRVYCSTQKTTDRAAHTVQLSPPRAHRSTKTL